MELATGEYVSWKSSPGHCEHPRATRRTFLFVASPFSLVQKTNLLLITLRFFGLDTISHVLLRICARYSSSKAVRQTSTSSLCFASCHVIGSCAVVRLHSVNTSSSSLCSLLPIATRIFLFDCFYSTRMPLYRILENIPPWGSFLSKVCTGFLHLTILLHTDFSRSTRIYRLCLERRGSISLTHHTSSHFDQCSIFPLCQTVLLRGVRCRESSCDPVLL